ncbi:hypothetical protein PV392_04110 [Streptomyces sp. ME03-5709C]|nr:hypothetical protein [Streptomyces sp. ME03-5709C]
MDAPRSPAADGEAEQHPRPEVPPRQRGADEAARIPHRAGAANAREELHEEDAPDEPGLLGLLRGGVQRLHAGSVDGDQFTGGKHHHYYGSPAGAHADRPGPVADAELDRLAQVYVRGPSHESAAAELDRRSLVVLQGPVGSGRKAAGLRLLRCGRILRLDPDTNLQEFPYPDSEPAGYLLPEPVSPDNQPLGASRLDALAGRLAAHGSRMVIVVDPLTALNRVRTVTWRLPEPEQVLRSHLRHELIAVRHEPEGADPERLLALPQTQRLIRSCPGPARTAAFARLLVALLDGRAGDEALDRFVDDAARQMVTRILDGADTDPRDKAFLIALAVFEECSFHEVVERADQLALILREAENPRRHLGLPRFDRDRGRLLELTHSEELPAHETTAWGRVPSTAVVFQDPRARELVLRHLWLEHPSAREPFARWLNDLAGSPVDLHRVRAAETAGTLLPVDFNGVFHSLVDPWSASQARRPRQLAAWALQIAAEGGLLALVQALLHDWSRQNSATRRWTAARTYATFGVDHPRSALADLRLIARRNDGDELGAVVETLRALIVGGWPAPVLETLVDWATDDSSELRDACAKGFFTATGVWDEGVDGTDPWPRLLRIGLDEGGTDDPATGAAVRALWQVLLASPTTGASAVGALYAWLAAADRTEGMTGGLARFLPLLVRSERDRRRLDHLVRRAAQAGDLSDPALHELRRGLGTFDVQTPTWPVTTA